MGTPSPSPQLHADALKLLAFYEIARQANLTENPDLMNSPAFQKAQQIYEARAQYLGEAFGKRETVDDYLKMRLEGALAMQGKNWEDVWEEFAPESLKTFPLAPGTL